MEWTERIIMGKKKSGAQTVMRNLRDKNGRFSEDALKLLALVTMFIDHAGAGIIESFFLGKLPYDSQAFQVCLTVDEIMRSVGRLAFPIYCYLLVQGFLHTRSTARYAFRLLGFALLSEIPFDLLLFGGITFEYQNVFWTLLIGLLTLAGLRWAEKRENHCLSVGAGVVFIAAGMAAAGLIGADYDYKGVVLIAALYLLRGNRKNQCIFAPLLFLGSFLLDVPLGLRTGASVLASLSIEFFCIFSFFFLYADNGKRYMKKGKYFFYFFYPGHLLLLLGIRCLLISLW